jgi:hypothetical protein
MTELSIKIGGASGYWGDASRSTPALLGTGELDYLVYDYLAEITMSIMARARAKNPDHGYAIDFVSVAMAKSLGAIAEQGVKVISNAGGVNPVACAAALREVIAMQGLNLTVACITGDDLLADKAGLAEAGYTEMFSGVEFPPVDDLQSINVYLGAFPIAKALAMGADIVITGRSVDSAVTLGACIHSFAWQADEWDKLAMGSLAGHILECGVQATGGNFTDWQSIEGNIEDIGYPIAEIKADGTFICSKPKGSAGLVSIGTIAEQLVYEIGDPQAYLLPDVSCDFSQVCLTQLAPNQVQVAGATGRPASSTYKVCATVADGFRGGTSLSFYGIDADQKAQAFGDAVIRSARTHFKQLGLADFSETSIELLGAESQFGDFSELNGSREVAMKIAVKHPDVMGVGILLKGIAGLGLATPPGLSGFQGARAKPSPVVRLFSFLVEKDRLDIKIDFAGQVSNFEQQVTAATVEQTQITRPKSPSPIDQQDLIQVPLIQLAWGRSGDKGNKANVGIIARKDEFYPYIVWALSERIVAQRFAHFIEGQNDDKSVEAYLLPGLHAINFLIHDVLGGGGVASVRNDAQGKGYAQILLATPISVPAELLRLLREP